MSSSYIEEDRINYNEQEKYMAGLLNVENWILNWIKNVLEWKKSLG